MRRNCNLELNLLPSSSSSSSFTSLSLGSNAEGSQQQEQMTIFYNGKICVCDVTEFQARSILRFANTKIEEGMNGSPSSGTSPISPTLQSHQLQSPISLKRSLKHFLEKRRGRIQATSPYHR